MKLVPLVCGIIGFVVAMLGADLLFGVLPTPEETMALAVSLGVGLLVQSAML